MIAIKFDEDKAKKCIDAYYDVHGKYPYLICNEETEKMLPTYTQTVTVHDTGYVSISGVVTVADQVKQKTKRWNNAKVLIDNELEFGEVHIG